MSASSMNEEDMFFFFNDTATTEIYTLSLHDALPILATGTVARTGTPDLAELVAASEQAARDAGPAEDAMPLVSETPRSEEHTSELQSRQYLVCRLLLEKKKTTYTTHTTSRNSSTMPQ